MKAVYIEQFGGPDVLTYGDRPDPEPAPDEVLIDVAAASVNAADWKQRRGSYGDLALPHILGRDVSGTVAAVGEAVTPFRPGDEVFAVSLQGREGGYAEKIALKEGIVGRKPATVSHVEAVSMALTGLTAVSALEETLQLQPGETILIQVEQAVRLALRSSSRSTSVRGSSPRQARPTTPMFARSEPTL